MKFICCNVNPFVINQHILLIDNDASIEDVKSESLGTVKGFENLSTNIAYLCHKHNVEKVRLTGTAKYNQNIAQEILTATRSRYGMTNIEVEVI